MAGFFDFTKPGKGVNKEDLDKSGIALYFDILGRRLGKIVVVNILFLIASIPAIIISLVLSSVLITLLGAFSNVTIEGFPASVMKYYLTAAMLLLTGSGSASAAMSYVLRKYVNDTHAWVWSDFIDHMKSNFLQGTLAYIINTVLFFMFFVAIMYYNFFIKGPMSVFFTTVMIIIAVIFLMAQMYVYQIMASVKLKLRDIYRNAILLTIGRLPVSIGAFSVTAVCLYGLNLIAANLIVLAVVPLIFYSIIIFTQIFITNNTINKYLIEPSQKKETQSEE